MNENNVLYKKGTYSSYASIECSRNTDYMINVDLVGIKSLVFAKVLNML